MFKSRDLIDCNTIYGYSWTWEWSIHVTLLYGCHYVSDCLLLNIYSHFVKVRISIKARCTTLCDKVCQWLATCRWFSPDSPVSSINKTDRHDITEILLKVALNTTKQALY